MALKSIAPSKTEWTVLHQHCTMEHWRRMRCRNGKLPRHLRPLRVSTVEFTETFCSGGSRRCLFTDEPAHLADGDHLEEDRPCDMCAHDSVP